MLVCSCCSEKLGAPFDTLDDITKFVYPENDAPWYPEVDYNDFRGLVKGLSKSPEPGGSASPKGGVQGGGKRPPRKKKEGKKKKGAKRPRKAGKKTPAASGGKPQKGKKAKPGSRRGASHNRRPSPTSSSEGYDESNESANRNLSSNSPVRHRHSPVRHENSSVADPDPLLLWESAIPPSTQVMLSQGSVLQPLRTQKVTLSRTHVEDMCVAEKEAASPEATAAATDDGRPSGQGGQPCLAQTATDVGKPSGQDGQQFLTQTATDDARPSGQDGQPFLTQEADSQEEASFVSHEIHGDATKTFVDDRSQTPSDHAQVCHDHTDMPPVVESHAQGSSPSSQKSDPVSDLMRFE